MEIDEIDNETIMLGIIRKHNKNNRWSNLLVVEFWANWMEGDSARIYSTSMDSLPEESYIRSTNPSPSYFAFYLQSNYSSTGYWYIEQRERENLWYDKCIALATDRNFVDVKVMNYPYFFEHYGTNTGDPLAIENQLKDTIKEIAPELLSFRFENSLECEDKLCRLIDIIDSFSFIQRLGNNVDITQFNWWRREAIPFESFLENLWWGYENIVDEFFDDIRYDEEGIGHLITEMREYNLQRLCLVYAFMAVKEDSEWLLFQIKEIIENEKVIPNDYTLWYLKVNKDRMQDVVSQQIAEIIQSKK